MRKRRRKEKEKEGKTGSPYKGKGALAPKRKPTTNKGQSRPSPAGLISTISLFVV